MFPLLVWFYELNFGTSKSGYKMFNSIKSFVLCSGAYRK